MARILAAALALLPAIATAHPGHGEGTVGHLHASEWAALVVLVLLAIVALRRATR